MNGYLKADPSETGCWISGVWGAYAGAKLIQMACAMGYEDWEVVDAAWRILRSIGPNDDWAKREDWELVEEMQDDVLEWMNDWVAPEGFSFEWFEGEFFLRNNRSDQEVTTR